MGNKNKSIKNFIFSTLSHVIAIAMGLIIPRITLTGYGSDVNGLLTSVTQFIAYLILFEAGIQIVATQSLYKTIGSKNYQETNEILAAVNKNYKKIGVLYFLGLIVLSFFYSAFIKIESVNFIEIFVIVLFSGLSNVFAFFFQGKYKILLIVDGKSYILTNINTIISILNHIIKIICLYFGVNIALIIVLSFVISLLQMGYILIYIKRKYKWIDLNAEPKFSALKQNKAALIHQVSGLIFLNTDVLLLTVVCGLQVVSVYSVYKLVNDYVFNFLKIPFESCSFALGQKFNTSKDTYNQLIDSFEVFFAALSFSVFCLVLYFLLPFMSLYTKGINDMNYVDKFLAILFVCCELLNLCRIPMLNTINYAGHFEQTISRTIIESIINIITSIFGVLKFGIYGVLVGTVSALLYRTTDIIIYANRKLLNRSPLKTFSIYFLNLVIFIACILLLNKIPIIINSFIDFIIFGLIITPIVVFLFFVVNYMFFKEDLICFFKKFKIKIKK